MPHKVTVNQDYHNSRFDRWFKANVIDLPQSLIEKIIRLNKVKIKSINMVKKHTKPTKENKGGIISKESFIHQSNVKNIDTNKKEKKIASKK